MGRLFRLLRADEIDCRIGTIKDNGSTSKDNGLTLLLYKDARCDMNILDETFGAFGWQRHHSRDNANCIVSVYDDQKGEWIEKEDTGTESNTEAEKGLASDSFKRACFNWGIGRELYTAPFIWIPDDKCKIEGKKCRDKFKVSEIEYDTLGTINKLVIANITQGIDAFKYQRNSEILARSHDKASTIISQAPEHASESSGLSANSQETALRCADCNEEITDPKTKDGKPLSLADYAAMCNKVYGRVICRNCRKRRTKTDGKTS